MLSVHAAFVSCPVFLRLQQCYRPVLYLSPSVLGGCVLGRGGVTLPLWIMSAEAQQEPDPPAA